LSGYKEKWSNGPFGYFPGRHSTEERSMFHELGEFYPDLPIEQESLTPEQFATHVLLRHPGVARFIAGKLFSMLVYPDPPAQVIEELAEHFRNTNYDILDLLKTIA